MNIEVSGLGKSFNDHTVFHNLTYVFEQGQSYSILGPNGSGKSTLLKILSGYMLPTSGTIFYKEGITQVDPEQWFSHLSLAGPYMELPEELTLQEFLLFHYRFKGIPDNINLDDIPSKSGLEGKMNTQIKNFSSGMKQRLKLAICLYSGQKIIMLDEPVVNLDSDGVDWYQEEIRGILQEKLVIIASNTPVEHDFCQKSINLSDIK